MKVFFILDNAFPSNNPSAKRVKCYCKGLNYHGIATEILTISHKGNPNENEGLAYKMIGKRHNGSTISKIKTLFINIKELKNYITKNAKSEDIVFLYSDGLITGFLPFVIGRNKKYVRELCEIPYYYDNFKARLLRWFYFSIIFKSYSGIVAISRSLAECANFYKSRTAKVVRIPILVDFEKYAGVEVEDTISNMIVFHSGSHTEEKDGFYGMVEAIGILKRDYAINISFYCTGNEPSTNEYKNIVWNYKLESDIKYLGYISDEELLEWQRKSSFFIINKYNSFQNKYCFATKLGEYLASGKLVVSTSVGEITNYLKDEVDCVFVQPDSPKLIAKRIAEIYNEPQKYKEIAANGYLLADNLFNCLKATEKLVDFLKTI